MSLNLNFCRCYERGKEKCYCYWPEDGKTIKFLTMTVKCLGVVRSEDYLARSLEVFMEGVGGIII